ncbi:uncharacterized protein BHQ10_003563 [Talaromyces amestolkiae]|uniref:Xylanolytic transcriptional activator regulatory domain-containing protein n=1 Tax=Talaromyces amestolkiae TaxID=1196081 RepID=A0A364KVM1_TALAM|nr:uncharacterized protein BHQ10_003563 [Talaromyces amestolkiae]RAO67551.1 hypothetical protein BHQ10_003563 [Talaromyces amestolkiae]
MCRKRALPVQIASMRAVFVKYYHAKNIGLRPRRPRTTAPHNVADSNIADDTHDDLQEPVHQEEFLPDDSPSSYIGDQRGPRYSVYDLCHPGTPQDAQPPTGPRVPRTEAHKPHEVELIRANGAFVTLPKDVPDEIIRCYFRHVHFLIPILNAKEFLDEYYYNGFQNINPLLMWSMCLASANFLDEETLQKTGFASRKAMKEAMYGRAKCLYDLDRGTDKLILIQSVLLLSFWYTDPQDHTGAWYWVGIAISLAQSIGIHRDPQFTHNVMPIESRPLVALCEFMTKIVTFQCHAQKISFMNSETWIGLMKTSFYLGQILRLYYRVRGPKPSPQEIEKLASDLHSVGQMEVPQASTDDLVLIHKYHLDLFYQGTLVVLYRPYVLNVNVELTPDDNAPWQEIAKTRARAAASATNMTLEKIIQLNVLNVIKPMIITALIPTMQIHLHDSRSTNALQSGLATNKLQLCMLFLANISDTYWSAGVMYRLFQRAQNILKAVSYTNGSNGTKVKRPPELPRQDNMVRPYTSPETIDNSMPSISHSNGYEPARLEQTWPNQEGISINAIDQLLNPDFALRDDNYDALFSSFGLDGLGQDQLFLGTQSETRQDMAP